MRRPRRMRDARPARYDRRVWVALGFLVACFLLGGSSRFYLLAHVGVRLIALGAIGYALWTMTPGDRVRARPLVMAVLALGGLIAVQLIPLPPGLWAALPGHGFYAMALEGVGLADRWRPWSMSPDLTLDSLLGLLPALAAVLLFVPLGEAGRRLMLNGLLACVVVDALLSVLQIAANGYYPYGTDPGVGVGFFANRNHHALWLAIGIVLVLGRWQLSEQRGRPVLIGLALVAAAAILPFLVVAGSRAGLVAGIAAFVGGGLVLARSTIARQARWMRAAIPAAGIALLALVFLVGTLSTRQLAVDRLLQTGATLNTTELRTANMPAMIRTIKTFFPLGSGFNTFDPVFRRFEDEALLRPTYFNRAHSEPIELLIEGGVPALILLVLALFWLARRSPVLIAPTRSPAVIQAQVGLLGIALLLAGSLVDYPVRTPFLSVVAMLLASWVADWRAGKPGGSGLGTVTAIR